MVEHHITSALLEQYLGYAPGCGGSGQHTWPLDRHQRAGRDNSEARGNNNYTGNMLSILASHCQHWHLA